MFLVKKKQLLLFFSNLAKARRIVENALGLWKERFRCIHNETQLRVKSPQYAAMIIKATSYLHNFVLKRREDHENDDADYVDFDADYENDDTDYETDDVDN